jgi:periplasmic protein TonB
MVTHTVPVATLPPKVSRKPERREVDERPVDDTFTKALLELPTEYGRRNPLEWGISLVVHGIILAALIITPLLFTQAIDLKALQNTWIIAPAPPPPAPPPAPVIHTVSRPMARLLQSGKLTAPTVIPKRVAIIKEAPVQEDTVGVIGGVPGGIPGGQVGGVLGGIIGSTGSNVAPPPPAAKRIVRVGGNLKAPRQVFRVEPVYPTLAKQARIQGLVIIDAVIDEGGNVVQAHAVSGPPLLIPAALEAVLRWKYQPSFLNGEPISVAMHVEVNFVLQ